MMTVSRTWEIQDHFGHWVQTERPLPSLLPHQVWVQWKAWSLNYRDWLMVQGHYNPKQPLPLVPGSDAVGEVLQCGSEVRAFKKGDRVASLFVQGWHAGQPTKDFLKNTLGGPLEGVFQTHSIMPEDGIIHIPDYLSDVEAATLPCAALTAWNALAMTGSLSAGQKVLILGTGGVATFALQFSKILGAQAIVLSSSPEKMQRAEALGAWKTLHYPSHPAWAKEILEWTHGEGVDQVIEVGGAKTLSQSLKALKYGGEISLIGVLSGIVDALNIIPILMGHRKIQGIFVGNREQFQKMNRALEMHRIRPVIDRVFPFSELPQALDYLAQGRHFGKICISL